MIQTNIVFSVMFTCTMQYFILATNISCAKCDKVQYIFQTSRKL